MCIPHLWHSWRQRVPSFHPLLRRRYFSNWCKYHKSSNDRLGPKTAFSIECCATKTKSITTVIHQKENITRSQWQLEVKTSKVPEAWENAGYRLTIYFSFESDWLKRWREFSGPVTWRSKAKTKQSRIAFNTRLKIAQCQGHLFKVGAELIMQTILNVGEGRVQFFQVRRAFSPIWAKRTGKSRITSIFISLLSRKNV